jgi:hypothetical protein
MKSFVYLLLVLGMWCGWSSCKKDSLITSPDARLRFSADTLKFDTVFTSTGSITQSFKIINENDQRLRLSRVRLKGGPASAYKINVDGMSGTDFNDIELAANDSLYVFVSVNINPNAANLPFIVSDSIEVSFNGNTRYVQLQAFGQNARFLRGVVLTTNTTWNNTLPYVILDGLQVAPGATLTIPAGVRVYAHADAPLLIDGTLIVNGTKTDSVVFAGDRLDPDYRDLPASWPGLYFREQSRDNVLRYAVVKNAYQGVVADKPSVNANPKVRLSQCVIDNIYDAGLLCINSSLRADNSLISNCGANVSLQYGGDYQFVHCTVASFSNAFITHKNPVLAVSNATVLNGVTVTSPLNALFRNCIFWGAFGLVDNEVVVNRQGTGSFSVLLENSLYKAVTDPANATLTAVVKNQAPLFDSINVSRQIYNFRISNNTAPGFNKGVPTGFLRDLDDKNRNVGLPDMGCYERQ